MLWPAQAERATDMTSPRPPDDDADFEGALGAFVIAWADAESELYKVLVQYAQVSDAVARAIFSGTRAKIMMDFIKSIAHNTNMGADRLDDLEYVFAQMAAINTMRDKLVHNLSDGYSYPKDKPLRRVLTNSSRASRYGKQFVHEVDTQTLIDMTMDTYAIHNHLNQHWGPRKEPFRPWRENRPDDPPTPWRYKSPQPIGDRDKSP
jgi:hypothetical protein